MARYYRHYSKAGRTGRAVRIGDVLPRIINTKDTKGAGRFLALWRDWHSILGDMGKMVRPLGHRGQTLILAATDPIVMQEAQFIAPMLLQKINASLKQEVFDKVVFELLNGRVPLDEKNLSKKDEIAPKPRKPDNLGNLNDKLDANTPLGRCYRAYQKLFEDT